MNSNVPTITPASNAGVESPVRTSQSLPGALTHFTTSLNPDPTVVGTAAAARAGNVDALRIAADKLRDAYRDQDAAKLDLLAGEYEMRCAQARQLRAILTVTQNPKPQIEPDQYATMPDVKKFVDARGLPIDFGILSRSKMFPSAFLVLIPTDGREVEQTTDRLGNILGLAFPDSLFFIFAANTPLTPAGKDAEAVAYSLDRTESPADSRHAA